MKKFEESIRKKLFGSEYPANEKLWKDIEKALPADKPTGGFVWSQWPGVLFILTAIIMMWKTNISNHEVFLQATTKVESTTKKHQAIDSAVPSRANSPSQLNKDKSSSDTFKKRNQSKSSSNENQVFSIRENKNKKVVNPYGELKRASTYSYYSRLEFIQRKSSGLLQSELNPAEFHWLTRQEEKAPEEIVPSQRATSPWALFMEGNPMLLYRQVTPNTNDEINITSLQEQGPLSLDRFGYQFRVGASYQLNHHWRLKAAFNYQFSRQQWHYNYQTRADSFKISRSDEDYIFEPVSNRNTATVSQKDHFYGLVAGINYQRGTHLIQNYNLELQGMLHEQQMKYFLAFDINLEKPLNEYWSVYGGPVLMWEFTNQEINTAPYNLLSYSVGLKLGVRYQFYFLKK